MHHRIKEPVFLLAPPFLLPPRSTAGQLTLDQHIGVRIPGGQPNYYSPSARDWDRRCEPSGQTLPAIPALGLDIYRQVRSARPRREELAWTAGTGECSIHRGYEHLQSDAPHA